MVGTSLMIVRDVRICVFGDSLVAGVGDPKGVGWVGRVAERTTGVDLTAYPLGVRGEATEEVVVRIPVESAARFARGGEARLVIATGLADALQGIDPRQSAIALDFGLASVSVPTLVVGPPPVGDDGTHERLAALDAEYAGACGRRGVPYLGTFAPLANRATWHRARAADGVHPDATGYGMLARTILRGGWLEWLRGEVPT